MPVNKKAAVLSLAGALTGLLAFAALAYASGGGSGEHHADWGGFLIRSMNFVVLVAVLVIVLRKPLKSGLAQRAEGIREELAELEQRRDEAKKEFALMEQRLKDAQSEREELIAEFRKQGEREYEKIIQSATSLAERIKAQAQFTIEQETTQAKAELKKEITEMSASVAEELLREKMTPEDQTRLVGEYLDKVEQEVQ